LYQQRSVVGGFANNRYWSSSENTYYNARSQDFSDSYQYNDDKNIAFKVRAVRAF